MAFSNFLVNEYIPILFWLLIKLKPTHCTCHTYNSLASKGVYELTQKEGMQISIDSTPAVTK